MAFAGDVQVVPEPGVEIEQQVVVVDAYCDDVGSGSPTTTTTKDEERRIVVTATALHDTVPEPDHHDSSTAAPEQLPKEVSSEKPEEEEGEKPPSSDQPEEQTTTTKPPVVADDEKAGDHDHNHNNGNDHHHQAESTRERLKRHRMEVAGRVWVPEKWGQEKLLKDWVDCAVFDRPLVPAGLLSARRSLVAESWTRRPDRTSSTVSSSSAGSTPLRVHNGCSS